MRTSMTTLRSGRRGAAAVVASAALLALTGCGAGSGTPEPQAAGGLGHRGRHHVVGVDPGRDQCGEADLPAGSSLAAKTSQITRCVDEPASQGLEVGPRYNHNNTLNIN